MRERKRQFHLSLGIAVCICLFFPLTALADNFVVASQAAPGGGDISVAETPLQLADTCEACNDNPDCASNNCGIVVSGPRTGEKYCMPAGETSWECSAPDSGSGCLIDTVAKGFRLAE